MKFRLQANAVAVPVVSFVKSYQEGVWGWLMVQVAYSGRFYNLAIEASSSQESFEICSIHFNVSVLTK